MGIFVLRIPITPTIKNPIYQTVNTTYQNIP
jgi:hypothetical protein